MSVLLDERAHAAVVLTALRAALASDPADGNVVDDLNKIPGTEGNEGKAPPIFATIELERTSPVQKRMTSQAGTAGWMLTVTVNGRTVDEARWALLQVARALNERRLVVEGRTTTPLQYETGNAPTPRGKRYEADALYTYAH